MVALIILGIILLILLIVIVSNVKLYISKTILCVFYRTFSSCKAVRLILCFEVYLYSIQALKRRLFRASLPQMFYPTLL